MIKNMKLFIVLKVEYGPGEENSFSEVLQITSSKSTAETFKAHYEEQFDDLIHNEHNKRWVSIHMHQTLIQIDDEIMLRPYQGVRVDTGVQHTDVCAVQRQSLGRGII